MYPSFVDLISHVESYKAAMAGWKDTDDLSLETNRTVKANNAVIVYPVGLDQCISLRFDRALARRNRLEQSWLGFIDSDQNDNFPEHCR